MVRLTSIYHSLPPVLQDFAVSSYGLILKRLRYDSHFRKTLSTLEISEEVPLTRQSELLKALVTSAVKHTCHYSCLQKNGPSCDNVDIYNLPTIFPILDKDLVKKDPKAFYNKSLRTAETTLISTSGTSGSPLEILATKTAIRRNYAFFNHFLGSIGVDEFQRSATFAGRVIVSGRQRRPPFWRKNYAMNTLLCSSYHLSSSTIPLYIEALEDWQPRFIDSYPSAIYEIASFIVANNVQHKIRLRAVVTSSESLGKAQRDIIQEAFSCPVYDQYGCAEMAVAGYQLDDGRYFIHPEYAIAEVVDDHGRPVSPGDSGHLVCTGLSNHAMPLIRYRIGDIVKTSRVQPEGYPYFMYLDSIEGRSDDVLLATSGFRVGRLDPVFKGVKGVVETQIVQTSRKSLLVNVVTEPEYSEEAENSISGELRSRLGSDMQITFQYMTRIPRERNGKFKAVKSEVV